MADIIYTLEGGTYFNITNKCPCNCAFCIRSKGDAVGEAKKLWFDEEPSFEQIKEAVDNYDFSQVKEAVFCGYGEPTNALDNLIKTAKYVKSIKPDIVLRLNTNGLSDLINGKPTARLICEHIDIISVSLNNPSSDEYDKITRSVFKGQAFHSMLKFTRECVECGNEVHMTVVDVISKENIEKSRKICEELGATFILRSFDRGR